MTRAGSQRHRKKSQPYMFRAMFSPIIRSTWLLFTVSGSIHPGSCRLVSWMGWNCVSLLFWKEFAECWRSLPCWPSKVEFCVPFSEGEGRYIERSIIFNLVSLLSLRNNSLSSCVPPCKYWWTCDKFVRLCDIRRGTQWRSWLRHCATSRKVAVSIPDSVVGFFSLT